MIEIPNSASAICGFAMQPAAVGQNIFTSAQAILAAINDELQGDGLTIANSDIGLTAYSSALSGVISGTVQILNMSGQELDDSDLQAQFTDAAAQENMQVYTFAVQQVIGASTGTNSGTGAAGNVLVTTGAGNAPGGAANKPAAPHQCGDNSWGFLDDPIQWLTCLTQKGLMTTGLLAIGLLIGVVLIIGYQEKTRVA